MDDLNQGLTQAMIDALCRSGGIGDMIEAENEKILSNLNTIINEGYKELSFTLVSASESNVAGAAESRQQPVFNAHRPANDSDSSADFLVDASHSLLRDVFHSGVCAFCGRGEVALKDDDEEEMSANEIVKLQRCKGCR